VENKSSASGAGNGTMKQSRLRHVSAVTAQNPCWIWACSDFIFRFGLLISVESSAMLE